MKRWAILLLIGLFAPYVYCVAQVQITDDEIKQRSASYVVEEYYAPTSDNPTTCDRDWECVESVNVVPQKAKSSADTQHNFRIGYGVPGLVSLAMLYPPLMDDRELLPNHVFKSDRLVSYRYREGNERVLANLTAEYSMHVGYRVRIGCKGVFAASWQAQRHIVTDELLYRDNTYYVALLVNVRFDWLYRNKLQMYSSFGAGIASRFHRSMGVVVPMYDATFVGLEVGRKFYGFFEIGSGASGVLRAGVGFKIATKR